MSTPHPRDQAVEALLARQLSALEPEPGSPCPEADVMAAWVERGLDAMQQTRVERHVSACARCQAVAASLVASEPVAEAVAPWWRRFDVRWLAPLGAAAAATVLWVVAPPSPDRRTGDPADTMARVETPAPLTDEAARPVEPLPAAPPVAAPAAPTATGAGAELNEARARAGRDAGTEVPTRQENAPAQQRPLPATADNAAAPQGRVSAAEEIPASEAQALERQTAAREAAPLAKAQAAAPAPPAATPPSRVAESAPAPAPPADPATFAGAAKAEAPARWRVADGRVERGVLAGNEWTVVPTDLPVTAVAGVSAQVAWAVGRGGLVLRTLDGRTWTRTAAPTTDDLAGITADAASTATVRSVSGTLYRTTDGGATWAAVP